MAGLRFRYRVWTRTGPQAPWIAGDVHVATRTLESGVVQAVCGLRHRIGPAPKHSRSHRCRCRQTSEAATCPLCIERKLNCVRRVVQDIVPEGRRLLIAMLRLRRDVLGETAPTDDEWEIGD